MAVGIRYAAKSDLGLGPKSRNEDSGYAGPHLLVLADGMGGHAAGDVASSMIVGALAPLDDDVPSAENALEALDEALRDANERLAKEMRDNPETSGMGSTTIALLRTGNKIAIAHIGDSRAYLLRDGKVSQITKDHSFVQALVDDGRITAEEAEHHPQRNLVSRVMTGTPDDEPDLSMREARPGDRYLLCSDGLSDYVTGDVIEEILTRTTDPDEAADRLIKVALKASTRDNVTVVIGDVIDLGDGEGAPSTVPVIVGAAARQRNKTRAIPVSPAEKAAALTREASGATDDDDAPLLAEEPKSPAGRWFRRAALAAALIAVIVVGVFGYRWSQTQYYVGIDGERVAIYQGVPQQVGPWKLSQVDETSDVALTDLPQSFRDSLDKTIAVSNRAEATDKVAMLRAEATVCRQLRQQGMPCATGATPTAPTSPATGPTRPNPTVPHDPAPPATSVVSP